MVGVGGANIAGNLGDNPSPAATIGGHVTINLEWRIAVGTIGVDPIGAGGVLTAIFEGFAGATGKIGGGTIFGNSGNGIDG